MNDCLFCTLISDNKTKLIYEDEIAVALPDIAPKAPLHILILPREHIASVSEITPENEAVTGHLFTVAKQIATEKEVINSGYRLVVNAGPEAGQTIRHLHMHLLAGQPLGRMATNEQV